MSTWLTGRRGYHDIDAEIDSGTLEALRHGLMQHHTSHTHLWHKGDGVLVNTTDGRQYEGDVTDVSARTGNVLIFITGKPGKPWTRPHVTR